MIGNDVLSNFLYFYFLFFVYSFVLCCYVEIFVLIKIQMVVGSFVEGLWFLVFVVLKLDGMFVKKCLIKEFIVMFFYIKDVKIVLFFVIDVDLCYYVIFQENVYVGYCCLKVF